MTWKYPKSLSGDFAGGLDRSALAAAIIAAGPYDFDFWGVREAEGDVVNLCFADEISAANKTTVDTIVSTYTYVTPTLVPIDNLGATTDPTSSDDSAAGYTEGSTWLNQTTNKRFVCIDSTAAAAKWSAVNIRYQKVIVDSSGGGDYTSIAAAFAAGNTSVFVRNGTYVETGAISIPNGGQLIGETMGSVVVVLVAGNTIQADATGGFIEKTGTIDITHNTVAVTGTGTLFTNLSVGNYILLSKNYYAIATITDDTHLTVADTYNGNTLSGASFKAHPMYLGVRINNLIVANSTGKGIFLRGCRNSTVYSVACKGNTPNFHVQHCGNIGIVNGASESSNGDGLCIEESTSVLVSTMGFTNATGSGISIVNYSNDVIIDGCNCNSNKVHGVLADSNSEAVNCNDTVLSNNKMDGMHADATTKAIVVVNCALCGNGGVGIDATGPNNSISSCVIKYNAGHGVNIGNLSCVSVCHVKDCGGDGLNLVMASYCTIVGNVIDSCGGNGIAIDGDYNLLTGNLMKACTGYGIYVETTSLDNYLCSNATNGNTAGDNNNEGTRSRHSVAHSHHTTDPTSSDDLYEVGDIWLNSTDQTYFVCLSNASANAVWIGGAAAPAANLTASSVNATGSSASFSRSDHTHAIDFPFEQTSATTTLIANATLTAAQVADERIVVVNPTSSALDLTMPTAAGLVAQVPSALRVVGATWMLTVTHLATSAYAVTLATAAGVTLVGSATVDYTGCGAGTFRVRLDNVTAASEAVSVYRVA